ncbi:PLP-dependent cysteine synthase family protein [Actinokineospora enzanensis]|uniref:PLP-dependent cysteine synthase family protein n=1 Tax=Actinokineospora enzanensis TaxID=155975 RepID=UPI0003812F15|nr:PLP-dependent cysteine synthase family protein [Actinokineospora enzanensis]
MTARVADSILDAIGGTPLVRFGRLEPDLGRELLVKVESVNPGGSHKVRIALGMILAAERDGELTRGSGQTIIESTGGNTGIGLAMASALLGYRLVLVIPDNYSPSKQRLLQGYGARVVLSDHRLGNNSHAELALRMLFDNPDWVMLNQQANPANPAAHESATALEILSSLDGRVPDAMVAGVGTGGHLTGVGRVLRQHNPDMRIVAVLPEGCSLRENRFVTHGIQGLAVGLVPAVLDLDLVDDEITVSYDEAVAMLPRVMRTEGLAVGISSAANLVAATRLAPGLPTGACILTFAYDGVLDYLDALPAPASPPVDAVPSQGVGG